uniref:Uncharacterized protein n=1 Tax=Solanum lycopersicum TaxID=4081 RepID=A0A3Q7HQ43_SOLLC
MVAEAEMALKLAPSYTQFFDENFPTTAYCKFSFFLITSTSSSSHIIIASLCKWVNYFIGIDVVVIHSVSRI